MTFRAHGVRLDLFTKHPEYEETAEKIDEICRRVSALRKAIEDAGLVLNQFEQTWGLQSEQVVYLYDDLKQQRRLSRYLKRGRAVSVERAFEKATDPLSDYHIVIAFLEYRNEKDLPPEKVRSMIIWLYYGSKLAPLGNISYVSKHFVF